jgi:uncharacterized membrane protein YbhN (UPF0104 family)
MFHSEVEDDGRAAAGATGRSKPLARLKWVASAALFAATIWFLAIHLQSALVALRDRPFRIDLPLALAGGVLYTVGMLLLGGAWRAVLADRGRRAPGRPEFRFWDAARTFFISQLGKYVPGKAMVIVIRYALLAPRGMTFGLATLTSFYETFCTMASGSLMALAVLLFASPPALDASLRGDPRILAAAAIFAAGFGAAVLPPVFGLLPRATSVALQSARKYADSPIAWSTFLVCLGWGLAGWAFLGASFWITVQAVSADPIPLEAGPALGAAFALSFVAGFVSMLPGQIGSREAVLVLLLTPLVGGDALVAVAAPLLSRLTTVLAEVVVGGCLYLTFRAPAAKLSTAEPDASEGA